MAEEVTLPIEGTGPATSADAPFALSSLHGWAALQRAVNVTMPQLLNQAETINKATLRLLRG